ncbi:hypothetical protein EDD92_9865 [Streptomyces sp. TLI_185]|nr:hypothetical protein EDD92_9865 [Streptomyces sp. TLI_185]
MAGIETEDLPQYRGRTFPSKFCVRRPAPIEPANKPIALALGGAGSRSTTYG